MMGSFGKDSKKNKWMQLQWRLFTEKKDALFHKHSAPKWTNTLRKYYQKQFIQNITFLGYPLNPPSGIYSSTRPVQSGKKKGLLSNPIPWEKYLGNIKNLQLSNLIKGKVYIL